MFMVLLLVWLVLLLRTVIVEYNYYQSVKRFEPEIWQQLGSPRFIKIPVVFISSKGAKLLATVTDKTVIALARKHRQAGIHFLAYVVIVLLVSILYFKLAN